MGTKAIPTKDRKFLIVQVGLILTTVILVVLCTIPFFHLLKDTIDRQEIAMSLNRSDMEVASLEEKVAKLNAFRFMGRSDSISDEEIRKQLEELQRKLTTAEVENQQLKQQMAMVSTLLSLVKAQPVQLSSPAGQPGQNLPQSQPAQVTSQPQPVQTSSSTQPGPVSPQAQPTPTSQTNEVSKPPDALIDNIVSAGDRITSMGEKLAAFGDKMTVVLTKLIGTFASFFTGMAVLIRWTRKKSGIKAQSS